MAYRVVFQPPVAHDLRSIFSWLADERGSSFASDFMDALISHCEGLSNYPKRGSLRDEMGAGVRLIGWRRTVTIAFRVDDGSREVFILGVFSRGRDIAAALKRRS